MFMCIGKRFIDFQMTHSNKTNLPATFNILSIKHVLSKKNTQ